MKYLKRLQTIRTPVAICVLSLPALLYAQTSGSLTPRANAYSYSAAPWAGSMPDSGGSATFLTGIGSTPGTLFFGTNLTLDRSPTLSQLIYSTPFNTNLLASANMSIVAASSGLTLNALQSQANTPTTFALANSIFAQISGGGTAGITKVGPGTVTLGTTIIGVGVPNTYTGGTHMNGGMLVASGAGSVTDGVFGASGPGNGLSFNGGALFLNVYGLVSPRDVFIGAGGATIHTNTSATLSGVISGSGALNNAGFASNAGLTLRGVNTYSGATISSRSVSSMTLDANGSIANSSSYDLTGTLKLMNGGSGDSLPVNNTNRLSDTAPVTVRGVNFISNGNSTETSSEIIGAVTAASSYSSFVITPGTSAANSLSMASLTRQNNATISFRGTGLGGTPGNAVANIYTAAGPALVGGGGDAGSTAISIVPWAYGSARVQQTAFQVTAADLIGSSFVTYGANGFRPLNASEYASAFGGSSTDNVRITGTTAAGENVTANAVLFAPAGVATLSGGVINVTSGAFLYSPTASATGTVSASLNFGAAEGVVTNTSALTLSGVLSGSGGVTYTTAYAPSATVASITLSGASTYTGNTTINSGTVSFSGTIAGSGGSSIFGNSGTIILAGGVYSATLRATEATTLNRDIQSFGSGTNYLANAGTATFAINGGINLTNDLYLRGSSNAATAAFIVNGNVTGTAGVINTTLAYSVFNGNNSYSGGTTLPGSSTLVAGSDTAFGTGTIYVTGTGTLQGSGTAARALANNLFVGASPTIGGTAPLTFTGSVTLNGGNRTLTVSNSALTAFTGVIADGAITKDGSGAVAFNSATGNSFTGGLLSSGNAATSSVIYVNNTSGSGLGAGAVFVGGDSDTVYSALAGSFTTSGATSIGGRLSPGNGAGLTAATGGLNAIGTQNFGSNLLLSSATTSSMALELASGLSFDRIRVGNEFTLAGTVIISTIGGYVAQIGDRFDLLDWGTISVGTFTFNLAGAQSAPGSVFDTSNFTTDGSISVVAVPEPATWMMGSIGLMLLAMKVRRRRVDCVRA